MRTATVITCSDRAFNGTYSDAGGEELQRGLIEMGYDVIDKTIVPDVVDAIRSQIQKGLEQEVDLIVTTGGTGVAPSDLTPEATAPLIKILIPGFSEALRAYGREKTATSDLSRGLVGTHGKTLIINLPGSMGGVRDGLVVIKRLAEHVHGQVLGFDHQKRDI